MRNISLVLLASALMSPLFSYADTVNVTFVMDMNIPAKTEAIVARGTYAFKGTDQIVFPVFGKTCSLVGSARAIGPTGCNYWITANISTGKLSDPRAENNNGCTVPQNIIASCK